MHPVADKPPAEMFESLLVGYYESKDLKFCPGEELIIEDLQQDVEHVRMRLLDFIEEEQWHYAIKLSA